MSLQSTEADRTFSSNSTAVFNSKNTYYHKAQQLLAKAGVTINGKQDYDIQVHDERLFNRVFRSGSLALGEAYVDGWWDAKSPDAFICKILETNLERTLTPINLVMLRLRARLLNLQNFKRCRQVVEEHYDLDNEFYSKMLDNDWMQYTCAYYGEHNGEKASNLQQAQFNKLDQICQKLELSPGQLVLELGSGFGGFAKFAAQNYGCRVVGYNISKEQIAWARNWTSDLDVEIREQDYRNAPFPDKLESFDKVVSVGLCEHVGYKNYKKLISVAHRSLKPGGKFLLHCIGGNDTTVATDPWLEKYVFPGSVMPSAEQLSVAYQDLFIMEDWHNFGLDYDKTCMAWFENFDRNWRQFESRYGARFYRLWKYYLLLCAGSFRARKNQNWEILLLKRR